MPDVSSAATPVSTVVATKPRQAWASRRFWACAVILGLAALGMRVLPRVGVFPQKAAVPLKRPLAHFDVRTLGPRYERHRANDHAPPLSEDVVDSLGTQEYLQLYLTDTQVGPADPTRVASLFITYYTGRPDMVPHVPDECYLAGGYDVVGSQTAQVRVPGCGAPNDEIPVRVMRFIAPQRRRAAMGGSGEIAVLYFFHVNGGYASSRDGVRLKLSNPLARYAYYSKIELSFTDDALVRAAGVEESLRAAGPLLEAVLPLLFREHFDLDRFGLPPPDGSPAHRG